MTSHMLGENIYKTYIWEKKTLYPQHIKTSYKKMTTLLINEQKIWTDKSPKTVGK